MRSVVRRRRDSTPMMRLGAILVLACVAAKAAWAGDINLDALGAPPPAAGEAEWNIGVGGGLVYAPDFEGSRDYEFVPAPFVDIEWRQRVFLSTRRGLGVNLVKERNWRAGPRLTYDHGRAESDASRLDGLGDVDDTLEAGAFATFFFDNWRFSADFRHDIGGGHDGTLLAAEITYGARSGRRDVVLVSGGLRWASETYMQSFFGVDAAQSARARLARFTPESGLKDIAARISWAHAFSEHWYSNVVAGISYLAPQASDSPIVDDGGKLQFLMGLMLGYGF